MGSSRRIAVGGGVLAAVVGANAAFAHHGFGNFDRTQEISVSGKVTGIDFVNPHAYVYFEVAGEGGAKTPYRCEMRAATVLRRSGWSAEMFKVGEDIAVTGAPDRFDARSCYVSTIVFADGTTADRYAQLAKPASAAPAAPATPRALRLPSGEPNLNGDWAPEQVVMTDPRGRAGALVPVSQVGNFKPGDRPAPPAGGAPAASAAPPAPGAPGGTAPGGAAVAGGAPGAGAPPPNRPRVAYTEAGQKAADAFRNGVAEDNPRLRCETTSILFDWTFDGPVNRITQNSDTITLQYGQLGLTRTVHMTAAHPATMAPSRTGHSIGRWENDVLIVDTVAFTPGVLNPPIMSSDQLHVVERFSLDPATMKITRSYTATDPVYYTNEYTGTDTIGVADLPYAPDACRELTFTDFSGDGTAPGGVASTPGPDPTIAGAAARPAAAAAPATPAAPADPAPAAKPWWKFWD